jgi:hypothetical protein
MIIETISDKPEVVSITAVEECSIVVLSGTLAIVTLKAAATATIAAITTRIATLRMT